MKNFNLFVKGVKPAVVISVFLLFYIIVILNGCSSLPNNGPDSGDNPAGTTTYIKVNTDFINQRNKNKMVTIAPTRGDTTTGRGHANQISKIVVDKWITWKGEPEDPNTEDKVNIIRIESKDTAGFKLLRKPGPFKGRASIRAIVKNQLDEETEDKYTIYFTVVDRSGKTDTFDIDPILRMVR